MKSILRKVKQGQNVLFHQKIPLNRRRAWFLVVLNLTFQEGYMEKELWKDGLP